MKAHPDKGGSEAKMAAVNEAYEVLSKPGTSLPPLNTYFSDGMSAVELRARFDAGDDPNDPMAAQQGQPFTGGFGADHPFAQFFQQSSGGRGGGGGGFQFHYSHR
jgi:DnaJ family protein C protein 3